MNINVDAKLHDAFKAITAAQGLRMSDVVLQFVREYVEKKQGLVRSKKGQQ